MDICIVLLRLEGETEYAIVRVYDNLDDAERFAARVEDKLRENERWGEVTIAVADECPEECSLSSIDYE